MDYNWNGSSGDLIVATISGVVVGFIKWLDIYLLTDAYSMVLFKVFITAIIGGAGGVVGKHIITFIIKKWKDKFKNKTNQP